ncbi:WRKY transcription factor 19 [Phytophthora cinnamomi]|uniref:WRKY transcription factor 19 n=1 Tax=Phytophthora cinnamomi TaxID=4785 RepID=UPI0035595683|nr:WRKY transcription factor 19 [Phytophthora cinnamomi]
MRSVTRVSVVLATVAVVSAHSWIDCFDTNRTKIYDQSASYIYGGSGGNGFCDGYGAGYPGRGDTDIGTEYTFKMLENEVEAGTPVCEAVDADTYTSTDWRKRISVAPGVTVYFAYLPNGHIVKDKKAIGTQHGIYWTGQAGTSLTSTLDMTQENLMDGYTMNFDDGNCGESYDYNGNPGGRAGDGKPCIGSFVVPTGTTAGIYSMVWYWTFWLDNEASLWKRRQFNGGDIDAQYECFATNHFCAAGYDSSA